jgi:hypothetical protein
MSYDRTVDISIRDVNVDLEFKVLDNKNSALDLSGVSSIVVRFEERGSTLASVSKNGTVIDAVNGKFKITIQEGDFTVVGKVYDVKAVITYLDGKQIAIGGVVVRIVE